MYLLLSTEVKLYWTVTGRQSEYEMNARQVEGLLSVCLVQTIIHAERLMKKKTINGNMSWVDC
jgi:hypothetical protein